MSCKGEPHPYEYATTGRRRRERSDRSLRVQAARACWRQPAWRFSAVRGARLRTRAATRIRGAKRRPRGAKHRERDAVARPRRGEVSKGERVLQSAVRIRQRAPSHHPRACSQRPKRRMEGCSRQPHLSDAYFERRTSPTTQCPHRLGDRPRRIEGHIRVACGKC